jgi:hypothetical protein
MAATAKQFSIRIGGENVIPITDELCIVDGAFLYTHIIPNYWLAYNDLVYNDDGSLKATTSSFQIAKTHHREILKHHLGLDDDTPEEVVEMMFRSLVQPQLYVRKIPDTIILAEKESLPASLILPAQTDGTPSPREIWKNVIIGWKSALNTKNRHGEELMTFVHIRFEGIRDGLPHYVVAFSDSADTPFSIEVGKSPITTVAEET